MAKKKRQKNIDVLIVTSAGFESATNGAEIRYSIQLNYEAILSEKLEVRSCKFTWYFKFCDLKLN